MGGSATRKATSGRLLRSMSLGAGQRRTNGDTPALGDTGSPEVNCQKCKGGVRGWWRKGQGLPEIKRKIFLKITSFQ